MSATTPRTLLVGVDYSADSAAAVTTAIELATPEATVVAVHAMAGDATVRDATDLWRSGDDAAAAEAERLANFVGATVPHATLASRIVRGEPATSLSRAASESGARLLVIGRCGIIGDSDHRLGATARALLRSSPCPVVVCSASEYRPAAPAAAPTTSTVASIMRENPVVVRQQDSLALALQRMRESGVHQLPVVEAGALIGIVALVDLERQSGYLEQTKVDAVMTQNPVTVAADAPIREAIAALLDERRNALPVLRDRTLVGIVSRTDILRLTARLLEDA